MKILSLTHEAHAPSGVFGDAARAAGHEVEEASFARGPDPRGRPADYGALLLFGGSANVDQEAEHPWLRREKAFLRAMLAADVPVLGVCLGSQLVAEAFGARVGRAARPEKGWVDVSLTPAAGDDPLLAGLAPRLRAAEWHAYEFELPPGAVELARSDGSVQAFRHGDRVWGLQFHAEVTRPDFETWIGRHDGDPSLDLDAIRAETAERMPAWNATGREICTRFLSAAGG